MAITYHAGRRIQGLSNDILDTVDYENTSAVSLGTGDSGTSIDLTGSTLDDSWTLRFKVTMTSLGTGSSLTFMVQNSTTTTVSTARDGIGLRQTDSSNFYDFEGCDNVAGNAGQYDHRFTTTPATDTKYVQITRISATVAKIEFYNSTYSTVSESSGNITIANITGLRYFVISNNGSALTVDDIDFWNGTVTNKPSNVQVGSRYEETDTRKMYNFTDPLVVDDDFSSSTGWTLGQMSISSNKLSGTVASSGSMTYLDLTSTNISDDKWNMRFGLKITATNTSSLNPLFIGLADSTAIGSSTFGAGDHLGTVIYTSDAQPYNLRVVDGGSTADYIRSSSTPVTNTQYYVEVIKNGANSSLRFYDSSDFTDSGSSLPLLQGSNAGSVNAFDYFMVKPYNTGSGSHTIEITDLKVYSGVTTTSNFWQEIGT